MTERSAGVLPFAEPRRYRERSPFVRHQGGIYAAAVDPDAALPDRHPGRFPGWYVVTACFVVLATSSALGFYGLATYLNAFSKEKGWEVGSISLATTMFFFVGGVVGVGVSRVIAKRDMRQVIVFGGVLGALALAALGQVEEKWQLFVVYFVFAVGWAASGMVPATTAITRWFHVKRSVALSVASTGLSVGGVVITPVVKWALDGHGLAATTPWLGVVWFLGIVPVTVWLLRPDPAPLGWLPDGARPRPGAAPSRPLGVPYEVARQMWFFWAVTVGYVFVMAAQVGGIQQLVKLVEERTGAGAATAATSVLAATSVVARLVGGRVVTRAPMVRLTMTLAVLQGAALAVLAVVEHTALLFAGIVLFGLTVGNLLMLQPLLIAERFGVADYPRIFSRSQFVAVFGTAGGPYLLGRLHDWFDGYRASYLVAAALSLAGAALVGSAGSAAYREAPAPASATVAVS
jgi:MFS family permease